MTFRRIEVVQALQEAQEQLLFQVLAVLRGEAGAADEQPNLAPNDTLGEAVENETIVVQHGNLLPAAEEKECEGHDDRRKNASQRAAAAMRGAPFGVAHIASATRPAKCQVIETWFCPSGGQARD